MSDAAARIDTVSAQLAKDGFAGPFPLGTPAQMGVVVLQLFKSVFNRPGPFADDVFLDRHLDSPLVAHLCTHPAILAQVEPLLGADLDPRLVHRSRGGGAARRLALSVRLAPAHVRIDPELLPPGGQVLPVGWRSVADMPAAAIRPAATLPERSR